MKFLATFLFLGYTFVIQAQDVENPIPSKLTISTNVPAELLAKRSVVFYGSTLTDDQLNMIQKSFQETGIDAVAYLKTSLVFAGRDVLEKVSDFLIKREISFLIQINHTSEGFSFFFTAFNGTPDLVNNGQGAWQERHVDLASALQNIFLAAINNQPKKNLLINDFAEKNFPISIIDGRRSDFFAIDLKVDKLAVPWFKHAAHDTLLYNFFKDNYPLNFGMCEPNQDKKDLRGNGFHYELCLIHTEGAIAREILGYPITSENAFTSVTFPNGELKLKTIHAEEPVYKFYLRHIESGNVFLGTKWDADITWQDALRNHIKGFKAELKIQ